MRTVAAGEFKAKCLKIMDEVARTGEPVLVTKRGKTMVRVVAPHATAFDFPDVNAIAKDFDGLITIVGDPNDLIDPIVATKDWEHLEDDWTPFPSE